MTTASSTSATVLAIAEALTADCACRTIDPELLRRQLDGDRSLCGLMETLERTRPHLFSSTSVYLAAATVLAMRATAAVIERVAGLREYLELALSRAPPIARLAPGPFGALRSYDFDLGAGKPQFIEVNTNAGGALLSAALTRAQQAGCEPVERSTSACDNTPTIEARLTHMNRYEWRLQRGTSVRRSVSARARPLHDRSVFDRRARNAGDSAHSVAASTPVAQMFSHGWESSPTSIRGPAGISCFWIRTVSIG